MTISYTLDVSRKTNWGSFLSVLSRWRGSVWKAVLSELALWTVLYLLISLLYRHVLSVADQETFEHLAHYLNTGLDSTIPLTFMLGFFVTQVVSRWSSILNGLGWIDNSAMAFANYIRGTDQETRMLRRNLVRYMVLNQALVLRDISMQVRKRFPTLDTLVAAGLISKYELEAIDQIQDHYSRYWTPIHWCYSLLYESRLHGKIASDFLLDKITQEIQHFRHGLASLLKYDWVPIPLLYPQLVFLSVRIYFVMCLIGRQFIIRAGAEHKSDIDLILPIGTMIQFFVYVGWMKVAEALLNPLGEDDDDLECNYVIDKNLITGLSLVDLGSKRPPEQSKDVFWDNDHIAPLYSLDAAKRTVHPLIGSASPINLVKKAKEVTMVPHKSKLSKMDEPTQNAHIRVVDVEKHNVKHANEAKLEKAVDGDAALNKIRKRHGTGKGGNRKKLANQNGQSARSAPGELEHQPPPPPPAMHPQMQMDGPGTPATSRRDGPPPQHWPSSMPPGSPRAEYRAGQFAEEIPQRDYSPYMGHIRRADDPGSRSSTGLRRY